MNIGSYDIVGLGVSTLDLLTIVDEFPGSEGVNQAHQSSLQGGGPVATALVAAAKLGARTAMIDSIGDDWRGHLIVKEFADYGVDHQFIDMNTGHTSSIASIHVRKKDGKRAIVFSPGNAPPVRAASLPVATIAQAKILHINGRHPEACEEACRIAKENGVKISFDGGAGRYRHDLDGILPMVDYCIIAKEFSDQWLGPMDVEQALSGIIELGSSLAVITMGDRGSMALEKNAAMIYQKAYQVDNIVDTTGCGDIFHGAFLYALVSNDSIQEALKIASAAAALKAQQLGGRGMVADRQQIVELIKQH